MNTIDREVGNLGARMETVEQEIQALRDDVREIRDAMVSVKGGWRMLTIAMGLATAFGALAGQYLPTITGPHP